ncbi:MAG: hypothetical protein PVF80_13790, partial [Gammaproteobacteria bacterium]
STRPAVRIFLDFGRRERLKSKADFIARAGAVHSRTRAPRNKIQRGYSAAQQPKIQKKWLVGGPAIKS